MAWWQWATEEEKSRFDAHKLLREYRAPEAPKPPAVPTPTPRPVPTPAPAAPRLPAFAPQVQQMQQMQPAPRQVVPQGQGMTYPGAIRAAVGQIPSFVTSLRDLLVSGRLPEQEPTWAQPITGAYEQFRQQIARPASMLTQEKIAAPLLGELMRWNVPYRALAPERAGPSPWAEIPGAVKRAVGVGEPLPGLRRLPAFAEQRYEEAGAYEETLPGAVRLAGRQLLDPLGLGGAWASSMLTGPAAAIYRVVDMTDYTLFLIGANKEERLMAAGLIGIGVTAKNLPEIKALVKRVAGKASPVMRRAAQEAAPAVQRFMAEEAGLVRPEALLRKVPAAEPIYESLQRKLAMTEGMEPLTQDEWLVLSESLAEETKQLSRRLGKAADTPEIRLLARQLADVEATGKRAGWTPDRIRSRKLLQTELSQLQSAARSRHLGLVAQRERYADSRRANWQQGLAEHDRAHAEEIARLAGEQNLPIPPEVLGDFPDLAARVAPMAEEAGAAEIPGRPRVPEAAPEAMRPMEVPPEEAARLAREAEVAAGQRRLGAPVPAAKQPWQMTQEEYTQTPIVGRPIKHYGEGNRVRAWGVIRGVEGDSYKVYRRGNPPGHRHFVTKIADTQRWFEEGKIWTDLGTKRGLTDDSLLAEGWETNAHKQAIEQALAEGKLVPPEVLADYPDLALRYPRPEAPAPEAPPVRALAGPPARPIPAEPAVPPPAVPAVPPVTAQPVPGAVGIPTQPPVLGAGAAVSPEVAPRPPVEPVPPEVPPPGSAELPGLVTRPPTAPGRLAPILDSSEILAMQRRPDVWRRMMTFAETHRLTPLVRLMQSVGISGTDPAREAMMVGSFVAAEGRVAAIGAVSDLRGLGDVQKLFGATDMVVRYKGKDYLLGDIVEGMHPELPLTADQLRYIQMGWDLGDELHAFAKAEGVDIPLADYPEGQHWWHRGTVFRRHPNGTIDVGLVRAGPGGRYIAAMMGIEHPRQFDTMASARSQGFHHLDPTDAMQVAVQQVYRRIADERVKAHVVEFIASRTERPPRWGEVELPGMRGRFFKAEEVGPVMEWLGDIQLSWADNIATAIDIANQGPRTLLTSLDTGPAFLQLLGTLETYPVVWTRAVLKGWQEAFSPGAMGRFLSQPEHAATLRKYAPHGLNAQGSRLTAGARGIWAEHGILGKIPLLAKGVRVGSAIFDNQMLAARILGLEASEYQIKTREDVGTLVRFWNTFTGASEPGSYGISRSQQLKESAFLFAPRLQRSTLSIMADVFQGGLRGKLARDSLGKMGAVGLITYLALCNALDQKPRLNPKTEGSRWMTVKVGDQYVGIGGSYFMIARTLIRMAMSPEDAREMAGTFVRSRLSPVASTGMDVLTQKDAIAMPVPTSIPELSLYVAKNNLIPIWLQGVIESGAASWEDYIGVSAMELMGLRVFPVSPARKRNEIRERLAQATFGKPWVELSRPETYQLEQVPELTAAIEEARALAVERETPWGLFWADVDSQREPYRIEIAELGQELQAGQRSGRSYREELTQRQMIMARIPEMLQRTREYQDIRLEGREPETAVDRFIDAYYKIADETRDPLTGVADARQIVMDREALKTRTPDDVVRQAMGYINRKLDPEYVQARDLYYEHMRIPQYLGLDEDEAQLANEAIRTYRDMRRANPQMHPDWTRAYLAKYNPEGYKLMLVAQRRRNPARQRFWAAHPLLSKFYSDLTTEELELVLPEENLWPTQPQAQLPAFAGSLAYGR